ncbi:tyrosine-type recombinase/integrase [Halobacillus shinanisalinarum]|uniref:Tyrosine-type recombinase/integrase n=1 Tax=Halobacillus shinanisalinarum TaxID=2932258 RepID=A0ABY4GVC3_9BACI|nr:tyrosine-type recombinase/integrase [Halobacillus shinanisalinarum]UOQ91848.1 tyrosine-type recombinase/integrase [Halobacillus shinanisalinarum]
MEQKQQANTKELGFHERFQQELSCYPVKIIHEDGSVTIQQVRDPYFLVNDSWNVGFVGNIIQFVDMMKNFKYSTQNVHFGFSSPLVNLEMKYIFYHKLFNDEWSLNGIFNRQTTQLRRLAQFLSEKYPTLHSLLDLDIESAEREWLFWLHEQGISTQQTSKHVTYGEYTRKSSIAAFLRAIHSILFALTDFREEWDKDRWDVRELHDKYGIDYVKSNSQYYLDFTKIEKLNIRKQIKRYIKQRLLSKNNFSWSSARAFLKHLPKFLSFVDSHEPEWKDLKGLKRSHMELYIQWLHEYSKNNLTQRNAHPENYVGRALSYVGKFLEDIQRYGYEIAPETHVQLLLFPDDKPKLRKKSVDQIDYIPDYVLEQLFAHINELHKQVVPVVWVAFKTGLRISDVLGLTSDCLERLNGKYSIVTDIEKTYVQGHRMPIDDELANILATLIQQSKENSNQDNNPEGFIFIRYRGSRKGKPFSQAWVQLQLNTLAQQKNIVDENGNLFHFKTHQFRHTYAVKLLNGGADIITVQELLAHASPEMTLRYAKLLDDTKRKAFESVISQGVFSFDLNGEVQEIEAGKDIPQDILQALWQDHKLNAMDNPYGTCHTRLKGDCPHMEAPPCLTCNGGSPCKDLAIGFSELDVEKYEMHVKTTSRAIEVSKQRGREDMAEKHERNLQRYQGILDNIQDGHVIFGRQDRMERKRGVKK